MWQIVAPQEGGASFGSHDRLGSLTASKIK
jgi:hypothetical protein